MRKSFSLIITLFSLGISLQTAYVRSATSSEAKETNAINATVAQR